MKNKLYHFDLSSYNEGEFSINSSLEVFYGKEQIGNVGIAEYNDPEADDEIVCFLPGWIGFQHYPVSDASGACKIIYEEYYSQKNRRK